jgi:hypothetical protein
LIQQGGGDWETGRRHTHKKQLSLSLRPDPSPQAQLLAQHQPAQLAASELLQLLADVPVAILSQQRAQADGRGGRRACRAVGGQRQQARADLCVQQARGMDAELLAQRLHHLQQ